MKKILWVGLAAPDDIFKELVSKGNFHTAAHAAQKNIIEGIENCCSMEFDLISGFMMIPYPKGKELVSKRRTWKNGKNGIGVGVPCVNLRYVDILTRMYNVKKECIRWANQHIEDDVTVFVYSAVYAYLDGAMEIKKRCKNAKIFLIITDLPQYMELLASPTKKFLKNLNWKSLYNEIKSCDGWILFTKHMADYLNLPVEKCLVMEGSINVNKIANIKSDRNNRNEDKIKVLFSGGIGLRHGVRELLNAFEQIKDENYELIFTGTGTAVELVKEATEKDSRIKYYGYLPTHDDVIKVQSSATMMISTRLPSEAASAYCFPSKIFEYLLSGKPVLSFKIDGIPDEYYDYLVSMKSPSEQDICDAILKVGNMSVEEREKIGQAGREFVLKQKNNLVQGERICKYAGLV